MPSLAARKALVPTLVAACRRSTLVRTPRSPIVRRIVDAAPILRGFSSPAITSTPNHDHTVSSSLSEEPLWMRDVIQKMMVEHNQSLVGGEAGSSPCVRDLEKSLQSLKNQLVEAERCIQDCHECHSEAELATEIAAAVTAVDEAVACFTDLLDDSRSDGSHSANRMQTEELVQRIKQLRRDVFQLKATAKAATQESTA